MLRGLVVMALLVAAPASAQQRVAQGGARPEAAKKTRIAVLDVQYAGVGDRKMVEGLSALLASEVSRRPSLTVIAGADLRALVGFERQKQLLGCTESSCIAELAGALGVSYLVSSEASKVGTTWLISLTLLDANRAMAVSRITRKARSDDGLVEETPRAVDELLAALPGAGPAPVRAAQTVAPEPAHPVAGYAPGVPYGYHKHDGGFFRAQLGGGALSSSATEAGTKYKLSGTCGTLALAGGFAVTEDLVLYGEIFDDVVTSPTGTIDGVSVSSTISSHALVGYGAGVAYYLMPFNGYVSATLGMAEMSFKENGTDYPTQYGPVGRISLGKEWWVSTDWGLGVSVNALVGSQKGKGTDTRSWTSTSFSLTFSATYN